MRQIFYIDSTKRGNLPPRVVGLVMEWAELHKDELLNNWNSLTETGNYSKIAPLVEDCICCMLFKVSMFTDEYNKKKPWDGDSIPRFCCLLTCYQGRLNLRTRRFP